jgi:ribosomal protein S18 acetylase RimI-like enzyme
MIRTRLADYGDPADLDLVIRLLDAYACDPMGGGKPLSDAVKQGLRRDLPQVPGAFAVLAIEGEEAVGAAVCFMGYGTFAAKPLVNVHDLSVLPAHRGKGAGAALLRGVAEEARARGCHKVTLEVRDDNPAARLYRREGFTDGDAPMRFLTRTL